MRTSLQCLRDDHLNQRSNRLTELATTPAPPYYAVIFTSLRTDDEQGYGLTAERMMELAAQQPGFLGVDAARDGDGVGITVSYWQDLESIANWRKHGEHTAARNAGRQRWYRCFRLRVAKVERASDWEADR